eukprot:s502_g7.t1
MPFANNGGNYHRRVGEDVVQSACGKSTELREALGATYMRECFRQAIAGFRRGAMRVLAEIPGVQVLATYTDIPPLPKQKSSETCRRPIACLLPDVGTIMKERLTMDDIDMGNEAILLRVATLRVTLGLALQKLLALSI